MRNLLSRYLRELPRVPEDGGGGGAGTGQGGDGAGAGAGGGNGSAAAAPADGGEGNAGGNGGDGNGAAGDGGEGQQPAAAWNPAWPEGFPEQLRGQDANETLAKVNKAIAGYREKDANRDIPKDPKDYLSTEGVKNFELAEDLKPHFEQLGSDPVFEPMAAKAKEFGIERGAFLNLWQTGMQSLSQAGLLEPPVDPKAERAALVPDEAKDLPPAEQDKAIDKRMQDNLDFVDLMVTNRGLDKEAAEYAQLMLADRAHGHKFLEWVRGQFGGNANGPGAHGGGGGGASREQLQAEMKALDAKRGTPEFDQSAYDALDEKYRKAFGSN
ncbi:hypothetical protein [Nitratireductor rhodophyticola]|uniref:hypothetical protein n=1 Tax=Nitratireductor rhodophyticola TaxID=2854036 RepID=UPI00300863CB